MIRRTVSAVLLIRDALTGVPFVSAASLRCSLDGVRLRPLWKPGGYLVLTDLAPGEHRLLLSCRSYRDREHVFTVGDGVWEREIDLEPAENYPLPRDATLLRLRVKARRGAAGAEVWAAAPGAVSLRLGQPPEGEPTQVRLLCRGPAELLSLPGWFLAADEGKAGPELLRLRELRGDAGVLDAPMAKAHPRGTELLRARQLTADADGRIEAVFYSGTALFLFRKSKIKTLELTPGVQEAEWKEG